MGLVGGLNWVRNCSRKQCRRVFWRMRAAVKKAVKSHHHGGSGKSKRQFKFQYDPCSYALNFDDGGINGGDLGDHHIRREKVRVFPHHPKSPEYFSKTTTSTAASTTTTTTWVYVIWLGPFQ